MGFNFRIDLTSDILYIVCWETITISDEITMQFRPPLLTFDGWYYRSGGNELPGLIS